MICKKGNWSFKTIVSEKTDKVSVCKCTYLEISNDSESSIFVGVGGGEIEIKAAKSKIINNSGVEVTHDLKFRFGTGTISVAIIKTELE